MMANVIRSSYFVFSARMNCGVYDISLDERPVLVLRHILHIYVLCRFPYSPQPCTSKHLCVVYQLYFDCSFSSTCFHVLPRLLIPCPCCVFVSVRPSLPLCLQACGCPAHLHVSVYWFLPSVTGPHWLRVCVGLNCLEEQDAANFHGAEYLSYLCGDKWLCRLRNSNDIILVLCLCRGMAFRCFECCTPLTPQTTFYFSSSSLFRHKVSEFRVITHQSHFDWNFPLLKFTLVHIRSMRLFLGANLNWLNPELCSYKTTDRISLSEGYAASFLTFQNNLLPPSSGWRCGH
jgi:hypothetical protein